MDEFSEKLLLTKADSMRYHANADGISYLGIGI